MKRTIWVAQTKNHKIVAMWWTGCVQPLSKWKKNVKSLGAYYIDFYQIYI